MKKRFIKHYFVICENKIVFNTNDIKLAFIKAKEIFNKQNKTIKIQTLLIPVDKLNFVMKEISNIKGEN